MGQEESLQWRPRISTQILSAESKLIAMTDQIRRLYSTTGDGGVEFRMLGSLKAFQEELDIESSYTEPLFAINTIENPFPRKF